jgi:hypothetical protein
VAVRPELVVVQHRQCFVLPAELVLGEVCRFEDEVADTSDEPAPAVEPERFRGRAKGGANGGPVSRRDRHQWSLATPG